MQEQDPRVNLKHFFIIVLFFDIQCGMKLTVQDVAYSLELLSGIHAS